MIAGSEKTEEAVPLQTFLSVCQRRRSTFSYAASRIVPGRSEIKKPRNLSFPRPCGYDCFSSTLEKLTESPFSHGIDTPCCLAYCFQGKEDRAHHDLNIGDLKKGVKKKYSTHHYRVPTEALSPLLILF